MNALLIDALQSVEQAKVGGANALSNKTLADIHRRYRAVLALGYEQEPRPGCDPRSDLIQ